MIVLDSDYMSLLEWPDGQASQTILESLRRYSSEDVAVTIVSFEEQIQGWIQAINKERDVKNQIDKYRRMRRSIRAYCSINVLDFDEVAEDLSANRYEGPEDRRHCHGAPRNFVDAKHGRFWPDQRPRRS